MNLSEKRFRASHGIHLWDYVGMFSGSYSILTDKNRNIFLKVYSEFAIKSGDFVEMKGSEFYKILEEKEQVKFKA